MNLNKILAENIEKTMPADVKRHLEAAICRTPKNMDSITDQSKNGQLVSVGSDRLFGGICWIGETVVLNGVEVVVTDTDMLNGEAKVGTLDANGLVEDAKWISWAFLCKPNAVVRDAHTKTK